MLEIPSFIATLTTLHFVVAEDVDQDLPEIEQFGDEDKCLGPSSEPLSVIIEPSAHEILHRMDVLEDAVEEFFLEVEKVLKLFRKLEIASDGFDVRFDAGDHSTHADAIDRVLREVFPGLEHRLIADEPRLCLLFSGPRDIEADGFRMDINDRQGTEVFKSVLDTGRLLLHTSDDRVPGCLDAGEGRVKSGSKGIETGSNGIECLIPSRLDRLSRVLQEVPR